MEQTSPATLQTYEEQPVSLTELSKDTSSPQEHFRTPIHVALSGYSRQVKRAFLRKGYQAQIRSYNAPLTRREVRVVANHTAKTLFGMMREQEAAEDAFYAREATT